MQIASTLIATLGCIAGFASAYYWWTSARIGPVDVPATEPIPKGGPGDMWIDYGGSKAIFLNYSRQSRLNALAAAWTGVSVLLQTIALVSAFIAGMSL